MVLAFPVTEEYDPVFHEEEKQMKDKRVTMEEAVRMIPDGANVAVSGAMLSGTPTEIYAAIGESYRTSGHPAGLTVMHAAGNGDGKEQGIVAMSEEGLITRYICGHFNNNYKMAELVNQNKVGAYNLPQGIITHMYRAAAGGKQGELTRIGLYTFCDPREQGGRLNEAAKEDIVELTNVGGEEYLFYRTPKLDIGLIRGTSADEHGNITMEEETSTVDMRDVAMAVKAMGGKVIAQVKNFVSAASIPRERVIVPGCMVDAVVVSEDPVKLHRQTPGSFYNPVLSGHYKIQEAGFKPLPLNERKIIARRAAMELKPEAVVNLGIGIPEGVAAVAKEEGMGDDMILTVEIGLIGGTPSGGGDFGAASNAWAELPMSVQFDYYHGRNLAFACLGFAEVDGRGNINVGKFGSRIAGCGGFIDISQSTDKILFCGTLTAGGLKIAVEDGKLKILQEGSKVKFKKEVGQITFSSRFSREAGQKVLFITERCVFELINEQLVLTEVAPGIDVEKDILPYLETPPVISEDLKEMDPRIFREEKMGLYDIICGK